MNRCLHSSISILSGQLLILSLWKVVRYRIPSLAAWESKSISCVSIKTTCLLLTFQKKRICTTNSLLLSRIDKEEDERDYFGKWHSLFEDTFLDRDLFTRIYQHMQHLLDFCPTERYLVHGNYSFKNTLAQNGKITAVVDWVDARYGDFVYDIAGLDFWCPWLHLPERFQHYYQQQQREVPFYQERLLCYQCYMALVGMRFFAASGQEEAYRLVCQIILQKLDRSSNTTTGDQSR